MGIACFCCFPSSSSPLYSKFLEVLRRLWQRGLWHRDGNGALHGEPFNFPLFLLFSSFLHVKCESPQRYGDPYDPNATGACEFRPWPTFFAFLIIFSPLFPPFFRFFSSFFHAKCESPRGMRTHMIPIPQEQVSSSLCPPFSLFSSFFLCFFSLFQPFFHAKCESPKGMRTHMIHIPQEHVS